MPFTFKGRLCGYICPECPEPLSNVNVRLYKVRAEQNVTALAVAAPKDTFAILGDDDVKKKQGSLIAETTTDDQGNFVFELSEKKYNGEAFEVDVYCGTVPHRKPTPTPPRPVQFSVTVLQPQWRRTETGALAYWEYCIPARLWCGIRSRFDAWTICGLLTTCKDKLPIAGATVRAFDADWLQDDPLGVAVTDAGGHFRIDYTTADFQRTPFSPLINFECVSGPDVYFSVEYAGNPIYTEDRSVGRTPGRENVGHCLCVHLCTDQVPHTDPEKFPHWTKAEGFNVHFDAFDLPHNIQPEGYAGTIDGSYVFHGAVSLYGNCPFRNNAAPTHPLKYRFLIAEWSWPGGGDGTAGVLPTVAPPAAPVPPAPNADYKIVKLGANTWVGDVYYNDGVNPFASHPIYLTVGDQDAEGFFQLDGKSVSVPMSGGGSSIQVLSESPGTANFVRSGFLMHMDSIAVTSAHAPRKPAWASDPLQAGRSLSLAEQEPIRRYRMIFQVRDAVTNADVWVDTLDSIVLDNSSPTALVYLQELLSSACNPITGLTEIHVRYTSDHPHLRYFRLEIRNNLGTVHSSPPTAPGDLPRGDFFPPGDFLFRGGASGPMPPMTNPGGFAVNISADPMCAYEVRLYWQTRHLYTSEQFVNVLYCKE